MTPAIFAAAEQNGRNKEGEIDMKTKRTMIALLLCAVMLLTIGCAASRTDNSIAYAEPAAGA